MRVSVCECVCDALCGGLYLCRERMCVTGSVGALSWHGRGLAVFIYSSDRGARAAARAFVDSRALAAGAMWRCRTASAPWDGRGEHTTVIDAAGAIYVIGGFDGGDIWYNDVWKSTDGGV